MMKNGRGMTPFVELVELMQILGDETNRHRRRSDSSRRSENHQGASGASGHHQSANETRGMKHYKHGPRP